MEGNEHRIGMIDTVAGETAYAQHLYFGLLVGSAKPRQVGLAKAVNLRGGHHGMAAASPDGAIEKP